MTKNFDPKKAIIQIGTGTKEDPVKDYMPVSSRIAWFRSEHPNGCIQTAYKVEKSSKKYIVKATISDNNCIFATAHASKDINGTEKFSALECAETAAIGRALAYAGYGTLEGIGPEQDPVDTPITPKSTDKSNTKAAESNSAKKATATPTASENTKASAQTNTTIAKTPTKKENIDWNEKIPEYMNQIRDDRDWKRKALQTKIPCGQYRGTTFKALMEKSNFTEIWYFANEYKAHDEIGAKVIAYARCVKEAYDKKAA